MQQKIASTIQNPAAGVAEFWIFDLGTKYILVASKIQKMATGAADFWIWVLKKYGYLAIF